MEAFARSLYTSITKLRNLKDLRGESVAASIYSQWFKCLPRSSATLVNRGIRGVAPLSRQLVIQFWRFQQNHLWLQHTVHFLLLAGAVWNLRYQAINYTSIVKRWLWLTQNPQDIHHQAAHDPSGPPNSRISTPVWAPHQDLDRDPPSHWLPGQKGEGAGRRVLQETPARQRYDYSQAVYYQQDDREASEALQAAEGTAGRPSTIPVWGLLWPSKSSR